MKYDSMCCLWQFDVYHRFHAQQKMSACKLFFRLFSQVMGQGACAGYQKHNNKKSKCSNNFQKWNFLEEKDM